MLRAARVLGALGYRVEGREPAQGLAVRGTADDQRCSGDGGRQRWGTRAQPVALSQGSPGPGAGPRVAVNVRERASRRAGNHVVEEAEAAIRALRVAAPLGQWAPPQVAGSRGQAARLGRGRQGHRRDPPRVEGPVAPGPSEGRGVVKHDAGPSARGDQRATLRPLLASAGLRSPGAMAALQGHDVARCRPWWARAAV